MAEISYGAQSDPGCVRDENQDSWAADPDRGMFIVSDGMAGQLGGKVASRVVVETFPSLLHKRMEGTGALDSPEAKDRLLSALAELSSHLREETRDQPGLDGMGATVVLAVLGHSRVLIGHMGDSRAYLLRERRMEQLTTDHSLVQLLIEEGEITPGQAADHPARGQLTRYVGMEGEPLPEARVVALQPADRLLLCTDGLTGMLSDQQIEHICRTNPEPKAACRALIDAANDAGGEDNVTALVIAVAGTPPESA